MSTTPKSRNSASSPASNPAPSVIQNSGTMETGAKEKEHHPHSVTIRGRRFNPVVLMVHFNIFLYAMCFWIQTGTLPYLTKKLGVNTVQFGYLQTTFAIVQLGGGPVFGRFGDLYGGRAALTLAFTSSALAYGLLGMAWNIPFLFFSRMPSVFMHAMQGGQMVVTDMAEKTERADSLGKLGISYGVGMVVGPFIGGLITKQFSEQSAAFVACAGSLVSVLLVQLFIPRHTKIMADSPPKDHGDTASSASVFSISKLMSLLANKRAALLLAVKAVSGRHHISVADAVTIEEESTLKGVPIGIFQSMFSVVAMETFELGPAQNGYIMSYIGVLSMMVQGFGIKPLTHRMSEMSVIKLGAAVLVFAYLGLAFVSDVWMLCGVLVPMTIGLTLVNVVITSAMANCVPLADTGAMLGVNMAVNSLIRTVSPTIGGYMLNTLGFPSFGYLGFVNSLLVTVFLVLRVKQ